MRTVLSISLLLPTVVLVATSAPAGAAEEPRTCRGLAATVVGTAGDDTLTGTRGPDVIVGRGGDDTIAGLAGDDTLCGGPGADDLAGGRGDDTIAGLAGDDTLCGGPGADDLAGGRGDDGLYGGRGAHEEHRRRILVAGDLLEGGPGDDRLDAGLQSWDGATRISRRDTVSFRGSARPVTVDLRARTAEGEGADVVVRGPFLRVEGSSYDDVLQGSRVVEELDGMRGDDRLAGFGGNDVLLDYHGDDQLEGGAGRDTVISTAGVDTVSGGRGFDFLIAWSHAPTTLLGGGGFDYMSRPVTTGETGLIDGGPGGNQLELTPQLWFGSDWTATLDAAAGTSVISTGEKTQTTPFSNVDAFTLWEGPWTFTGTEGEDFVQVIWGRLEAQGLGGDDSFIGAERNDVLDGGPGSDEAWGGEGRNTCIDTETGECSGYPWDTTTRARLVTAPRPTATAHHRLVARWLGEQAPRLTRQPLVAAPATAG